VCVRVVTRRVICQRVDVCLGDDLHGVYRVCTGDLNKVGYQRI
jgi:hypothetical protein